ncbi:FKBP-type peptidyl-prolyl cis-trans isomerase [Rubrivirga sp.]|uniref:FKBP-type peptidyl-prolyl cis-trans isomerase n=1 Tax=Rubrivirga sp. TaxID=1885344 RepID=UPI003B52606E
MRAAPLVLLLALAACEPADDPSTRDAGAEVAVDTTVVAEPTSTVTVAYKGRLETGEVFDQNERATFNLERVIPGFQTGIAGMHVGESKTLLVPPEDGYGADPPPGIPPNATLIFEVTLLDVGP